MNGLLISEHRRLRFRAAYLRRPFELCESNSKRDKRPELKLLTRVVNMTGPRIL